MNNNFKIIGFSGKLGVGKNFVGEKLFGKKLFELGYNVHILAFGDQVKYELGSRIKYIEDGKIIKEMDEIFELLFVNKTTETRQNLEYYEIDYWKINEDFTMLNLPNIWIKGMYLQIKNILSKSYSPDNDVFIITDVRFKNEAEFIKLLGGIIIRINAPSRNEQKIIEEAKKEIEINKDFSNFITKIKNHSSQTNLDVYTFDYVIDNEPTNTQVEEEIGKIIYNI